MRYIDIIPETITDGEGIRTSIYVAGCQHHCKGCHNPETWDYAAGHELTDSVIDDVISGIKNNPLLCGVTFSGGDPLSGGNVKDILPILKKFKDNDINIWLFTGFYIDDITSDYDRSRVLAYVDFIVDGPYVEKYRNVDLLYRGSENQGVFQIERNPDNGLISIIPKYVTSVYPYSFEKPLFILI